MEAILACDGVMVARGDLGVELQLRTFPRLIATANRLSIMSAADVGQHGYPRPTRAEVSDV